MFVSHRSRWWCALLLSSPLMVSASVGRGADLPLVASYLEEGRLADGEAALRGHLERQAEDQQARFGLGVVQFLQAVERLAQAQYTHGLQSGGWPGVPFLRLPVPQNPEPEPLDAETARGMLRVFVEDLVRAEASLARVDTAAIKLPIRLGRVRLDFNADGRADPEETLWRIFNRITGADVPQPVAETFTIVFDGGDVHWLRGYCHLLSALGEFVLAHDCREPFERVGHLFYERTTTPHDYLRGEVRQEQWDVGEISDLIALVHLVNLPVQEPERLRAAHAHLLAMIGHSRKSWELILAEDDDDSEWIPNPRQTGVIPNVRIQQPMIDAWRAFLDEFEELLHGRRLLPFWRGSPEFRAAHGVNFKRALLDHDRFDLVLWVQGTAAEPYLERGTITDVRVWAQLQGVFGADLFGFAVWFN